MQKYLHSSVWTKSMRFVAMLVIGLGISAQAFAQSTLDKAWASFNNNKLEDARKLFTEAANDPKYKQEAHLALSLMAGIDKTGEESFQEFLNFYHSSDNPYPYLSALWYSSVFGGGRLDAEQLAFLKELLEDPKMDGTLKARLYSQLGRHFEASNNIKNAVSAYKQLGTVDDWQVAGTFENISGSGFDKDYEPIASADNSKVFLNKYGAQVKWFDLPTNRFDKWVDFSYPFYQRNAIVYAQTFVNSPDSRELQLRVGTSGSLKVWVNDKLQFSESEERNNGMDTYIMGIKLNKGYNRILLQVGSSEISGSNFMVRLTNDKGVAYTDFTFSRKPQSYTKETAYVSKNYRIPTEEYFEKMVASQPNNMIGYLMLAEAYLSNDKIFEARKVLEKAQAIAPNSSYVRVKLAQLYIRDENKTDLTTSLEWLKDNDPNNPISLGLLYQDEVDKENYTEAEKILGKIESLYGIDEGTLTKRIQLAAYNKKQEEVIRLTNECYKKYPDNYTFVSLKHAIAANVDKNYGSAIAILKKYLKTHYSSDAMTTMAEDFFNKGDIAAGLAVYDQIIAHDPGEPANYYDLANIYYQIQNYDMAATYFKKAIDLAPYIGSYWGAVAKVYNTKNKTQDAIDAYTKAVTYSPTDYDARKELRKLQGQKEIFEYFEQPDVYAAIKNAPAASKYPEDNSVILMDETQKVVYKGGAAEEKHIFAVKVYNPQGVDVWKQYDIGYSGSQRLIIEKAEVVKANGSKVEAETNDNEVVFTALEVGDAIHVTYRLENYLIGKLSPAFMDKVYFKHFYPYLDTKYSLLIEPEVKFSHAMSLGTFNPVASKKDGFDMYVWEKKNEESIKTEDHMPELVDVAPVLYISSFPDWTFVSNWYADLTANKSKGDYEVKATVAELFKDKQNLSQRDKVKEIYNYIVHNIRYSSVSFLQSGLIPQKASKVLNTKIGDCKDVSTLFVAMCREIGVDASLVLVKTRDYGKKDMLLPCIDFNHCIAKVTLDNQAYYIEMTSDYLPFNSFYTGLINSYTLDITPEQNKIAVSPKYLNPSTRNRNIITRVTDITFDNNDVMVTKINYKTGAFAADMRSTYRDLGKKEQEKAMQRAVTGEYPSILLTSLTFKGLEDRGDSVEYKYSYTGQNAITQVGGLNLFSLPWASKASPDDFVFGPTREYPVDVDGYSLKDGDMETITITLPASKKLAEVPQSINYSCSVADYSLNFKVVGNKIVATRELKFKKDNIPAENFKEFGDFYKKVITADTRQIAFK